MRRSLGIATLAALLLVTAAGVTRAESIRIGCPAALPLYYLPASVADSQGFFRKEGLTVEMINLVGSDAAKALLAKSVDVSCNSLDHAIKAAAQGQQLKMIVAFQRTPAMALLVLNKHRDQIKSVRDLKGRAVGISVVGASAHLMLRYVLDRAGLGERDVRLVSVPGPAFIAAMKQGQIDAGMNFEPFVTRLIREGVAFPLLDLRPVKAAEAVMGGPEFVHTGMLARAETIRDRPATIQKVVNAIVRAHRWIQEHSPADIANALPDLKDKEDFITAMGTLKDAYYPAGVPTEAGVIKTIGFHRAVGTLTADQRLDPRALLDTTFVLKASAP
ncbi:MAG: ABC transporter substrate-binding protein [Candidatus Rokubacteria bacterium]|nr:ABC transporter substrate-binding protein [Candidatus Rokubacteria bacterium]